MAIELAYINTKHPDFADACGLMNNNIEVSIVIVFRGWEYLQVISYKRCGILLLEICLSHYIAFLILVLKITWDSYFYFLLRKRKGFID